MGPESQQLAPETVNAGSIAIVIVYLVIIVAALYFVTKYVNKRRLSKGVKKNTAAATATKKSKWGGFFTKTDEPEHIVNIVDRVAVDRDKTLIVVEFMGRYYLMSTTGQDMHLLDKLPADAVGETQEENTTEAEEANPAASCDVTGEGEKDAGETGFFANFSYLAKQQGSKFKNLFSGGKKEKPISFEEQLKRKMEKGSAAAPKSAVQQAEDIKEDKKDEGADAAGDEKE